MASQSPESTALCTRMMVEVACRSPYRELLTFHVTPFDSFTLLRRHKTFQTQDHNCESSNTFESYQDPHFVSHWRSFIHYFACSAQL